MEILKKPTLGTVESFCRGFKCTRKQYSDQHRRNSEDAVRAADKAIRTGKKVWGRRAGELVMMALQSDYLAHNALTGE